MRALLLFLPLLLAAAPSAAARTSLGQYHGWGVFRDAGPARCFAIARPLWRRQKEVAFAAFTAVPASGTRQFHVRLSRERRADRPVTLAIGERRFTLLARGADAWGQDARADARIAAAARAGGQMVVSAVAANGRRFRDFYALEGAASAIDAATLACL